MIPPLSDLLDTFRHTLPALNGRAVSAGAALPCATDEAARLYRGLQTAFPDAGAVYWGCRSWQIWLWQPVFFSVWTAALWQAATDLRGFGQEMSAQFSHGFCVYEQPLQAQPQAVFQAACALRVWMRAQLPLWQPHYPLKEKLAACFLDDAVLNALAAAHRCGLLNRRQTAEQERLWRQYASQPRCCGRLLWTDEGCAVQPAVCCQHDRSGASPCAACPKRRHTLCTDCRRHKQQAA